MTSIAQGLLANLGLIAIFASAWVYGREWLVRFSGRANLAVIVVLAAGSVIALMSLPFEIQPGVKFDLRLVPVALSGFFGGPLVGVATGAVAIVYRLWWGGAGVPAAMVSVVATTAIGIAGHRMLGGRPPQLGAVVFLGLATAAVSLLSTLLLPVAFWVFVLPRVAVPSAVIIFAAIAATGATIVVELRRREVEAENRLYRALIDSLPEPMNAKDAEGRFLIANPATAELMQAGSAAALIGKTDFDFYPSDIAEGFRKADQAAMASGGSSVLEQHVVRRDGSTAWFASLKAPFVDEADRVVGLTTHNRDISDRKRLEAENEIARQQLDGALANMADGLVLYDGDGRILLCNQRYRDLYPITGHLRVPGARLEDILRASIAASEQLGIEPGGEEAWIASVRDALRVPASNLSSLKDGRWIQDRVRPMPDGGALVLLTDVTAARQAEQQLAELNRQLAVLARHDGLTGLANRRTFEEVLQQELERSERSGAPLSLLMLDVDDFKAYNDTYGHPAGDACLCRMAEAFGAVMQRPGDLAARYGGEEFAAILPWTDEAGAMTVAEAVRVAIRDLGIQQARGRSGVVTASIGVATSVGPPADTRQTLIDRADRALYAAKAGGRDRVAAAGSAPSAWS